MQKREQTLEERALAEFMRLALESEHRFSTPEPKTVSAFRKETYRIPTENNIS
jgi:hypothetical protein